MIEAVAEWTAAFCFGLMFAGSAVMVRVDGTAMTRIATAYCFLFFLACYFGGLWS